MSENSNPSPNPNSTLLVTVSRFTPTFPVDEPNSYIVGFTVKCPSNAKCMYKETRILYKDLKSHGPHMKDEDVMKLAWERLDPHIKAWKKDLQRNNGMRGMTFTSHPY